jgi:hypothetical protein
MNLQVLASVETEVAPAHNAHRPAPCAAREYCGERRRRGGRSGLDQYYEVRTVLSDLKAKYVDPKK